jgi:hypothetical protein
MISCRADLFKHLSDTEIAAQIDVYEEPKNARTQNCAVHVFFNASLMDVMKDLVMTVSGQPWSESAGWSIDPKDGCGCFANYETGLWFYKFLNNGDLDISQAVGDSIMSTMRNLGIKNKIDTAQKESCYNDPNEIVLHMARYYLTHSDIKKLSQ